MSNPDFTKIEKGVIQLIKKYQRAGFKLIEAVAKTHSQLTGSWACALIDKRQPDKIYLFAHGEEIYIDYLIDQDTYVFSTDEKALDKALTQGILHHKIFYEEKTLRRAKYELKGDRCLVLNQEPILYKLPEPALYWNWKKGRKDKDNKVIKLF